MICEQCERLVHPIDVKDDDDDNDITCDTCGSLAIKVPGIGIACMKSGQLLVEIKPYWLYHPEEVVFWRRLKWRIFG